MTETMVLPAPTSDSTRPRYLPIAEHGVIGDLQTVALVGSEGTIDWYCPGRFDAPSVFGAILDADKGGSYRIAPAGEGWTSKQLYFPDTNVLITRFLSHEGVAEVIDFMPVTQPGRLVRRVLGIRGELTMRIEVEPRFDYGRAAHETMTDERGAYGEAELRQLFVDTVSYWLDWLKGSRYTGRWREAVNRSALTLKLLTYQPSGSIVAAATTSLPEQLGGPRNCDYRFTWIRDASFSLYALLRLGFTSEAEAFMCWLTDRVRESDGRGEGPLQIMYGIDGRADLEEVVLDHLEGYRGSAPVRIGNGAADQLQLDIYGELIDSVYLYNKYATPIYHEPWQQLAQIVEWVCENWDKADEGIWETRGGQQNFTYSRLQTWVAVERAIRIARQRGLPADLVRWGKARDAMYAQIHERAWNPKRGAFVQHLDTDVLDASVLLMPLTKFISPTDPRWLSTLDAIERELVSDSLVYRYNASASPDGLAGDEGTFSICSFWYIEALARSGRVDHARLAFEKMLTYANHLGLYSEELGPTGEALGNFPQAFTHLSLISAAVNLDRQLG